RGQRPPAPPRAGRAGQLTAPSARPHRQSGRGRGRRGLCARPESVAPRGFPMSQTTTSRVGRTALLVLSSVLPLAAPAGVAAAPPMGVRAGGMMMPPPRPAGSPGTMRGTPGSLGMMPQPGNAFSMYASGMSPSGSYNSPGPGGASQPPQNSGGLPQRYPGGSAGAATDPPW